MATIRFVLRTDKPDKKGLFPVQMVYQISGQRKYFKTRQKLFAPNWSAELQQAVYIDKKQTKTLLPGVNPHLIPLAKEIDEINQSLHSLRKEVGDIERRFELNKVEYSPEMVIASLNAERKPVTKKDAPINEIFHFIDRYISDHAGIREPGSLSVYKSLRSHLQAFQVEKRKKITFGQIDYSFFQEFQNFLINNRNLNNTTVAKQLSTIKTFLNYARLQGIDVPLKYKDFKIKRENLEVIALTSAEFEKLFNLDLTGKQKLQQVRDVFCFSCVTGLRYSDLAQLKREHIKEDEIRITVKKTKEFLTVPLSSYSQSILEKYQNLHRPLPVISNPKMNAYIKELCQEAEINEPVEIVRFRGAKREAIVYPKYELITVHTGRKTFATLSLEKGMSAEEVMTITGHKDYKSFKRYVKITEQRKKVVMRNAWGEIKLPQLKAI